MKLLSVLLAIALLVPVAECKPWYKDPKVIALAGVTVAVSALQWKASRDCRERAGVEHCFGGYGSRKAMMGLQFGTQAGFFALSLYGRHEGLREWWVPTIGSNALWATNAALQTQRQCRKVGLVCAE